MDKNLSALWKIALGEIETEISRANFLTLLKNTALISLENNTATIASPSTMHVDLLQKRYATMIKKSLDKQTKNNIALVFVVKTIPDSSKKQEQTGPLFDQPMEENREYVKTVVYKPLSRVRTEFTFETMAVSSSNQLAYVSAQTVAKNPGHSYNPLFIYGPVGVGKTHLMQAVANEVNKKSPDKKIIYITSEEFTNEVVEAIRGNDTGRMKKRFRTVDLLIIDDVQFIAGKDKVQEELFHTFNILIDNAAQIVLSSDKPPQEIKKLEKRLSSRFSAGLTVDIESPDFELRTAILLIKAKKHGIDLPIDIAKMIAEKTQDVRSLEGTFLRIITEAKTKGQVIDNDLVLHVLNGRKQTSINHFHPDDYIQGVCSFYDIKSTQIKGPKRDARLVKARQIAMHLLKKELGLTFVEIGNILGGRDHTTIMYGVGKIEKLIVDTSSQLSAEILGITNFLSQRKGDYS